MRKLDTLQDSKPPEYWIYKRNYLICHMICHMANTDWWADHSISALLSSCYSLLIHSRLLKILNRTLLATCIEAYDNIRERRDGQSSVEDMGLCLVFFFKMWIHSPGAKCIKLWKRVLNKTVCIQYAQRQKGADCTPSFHSFRKLYTYIVFSESHSSENWKHVPEPDVHPDLNSSMDVNRISYHGLVAVNKKFAKRENAFFNLFNNCFGYVE